MEFGRLFAGVKVAANDSGKNPPKNGSDEIFSMVLIFRVSCTIVLALLFLIFTQMNTCIVVTASSSVPSRAGGSFRGAVRPKGHL